jgi:hypothetical protein
MLQLLCLAILMIYAGAIGCRPEEIELPFETIEQEEAAGEIWYTEEAGLMIIATPEDLAQIDDLFTKDAQVQLREMDFGSYFAIASFLGRQGGSHEGIETQRVVRRGDAVSVYVHVGRPGMFEIVTSPYHLVRVRKEGNWEQRIESRLYLEGEYITSLAHFIP